MNKPFGQFLEHLLGIVLGVIIYICCGCCCFSRVQRRWRGASMNSRKSGWRCADFCDGHGVVSFATSRWSGGRLDGFGEARRRRRFHDAHHSLHTRGSPFCWKEENGGNQSFFPP